MSSVCQEKLNSNGFFIYFKILILMAVFDVFDPLANVTPRFKEEELANIIEWFDNNSKPLLIINEVEPINVITVENLKQYLDLKK